MNLVELFCHVDDFCQAFEGQWIRYQLTTGRRRRRRAGQLCFERDHDAVDLVPSVPLSAFQSLLPAPCLYPPVRRVSGVGQLWVLCRVNVFDADSVMRLFTPIAYLIGDPIETGLL